MQAHLSYLWLVTAAPVMVRSSSWVATAPIGQVRLVVLTLASYTSIAVLLTRTVTIVLTASLYVALRIIDTLIYWYTLYPLTGCPVGQSVFLILPRSGQFFFRENDNTRKN